VLALEIEVKRLKKSDARSKELVKLLHSLRSQGVVARNEALVVELSLLNSYKDLVDSADLTEDVDEFTEADLFIELVNGRRVAVVGGTARWRARMEQLLRMLKLPCVFVDFDGSKPFARIKLGDLVLVNVIGETHANYVKIMSKVGGSVVVVCLVCHSIRMTVYQLRERTRTRSSSTEMGLSV